ncbi:MAG: cupin domain-containing protein [Solirubrobacterales bacterium]
MRNETMLAQFENGTVAGIAARKTAELPWNPHSVYPGVFLKHLLTGEETGGGLSCHLVRIEPGCKLLDHEHPGKLEVHQVLEGLGDCRVNGTPIPYRSGTVAMMPADTIHCVEAGAAGLVILAAFAPALL